MSNAKKTDKQGGWKDREWNTLVPEGRSAITGVEAGWAVRCASSKKNKHPMLELSLSPNVVKNCGFVDGEFLTLNSNGTNLLLQGRNAAGAAGARKLHISKGGRGTFSIVCSGDIAAIFGTESTHMSAFTVEAHGQGWLGLSYNTADEVNNEDGGEE
jgi:hypothetical protein